MVDRDTVRGLAIGYIVAISLSILFFLIVVPVLGCLIYRRRKSRLRARTRAAQTAYAQRHPGNNPNPGYHPFPNYGYGYAPQGQQYGQVPQQQGVSYGPGIQQGAQYNPAHVGYYGAEVKPPQQAH